MATASPIVISPAPAVESFPETRGYYLLHSESFSKAVIRRRMQWAARAGFNMVIFPVYVNGYTFFPSEASRSISMGAINPLFRKWNPLGEAVAIAEEMGLSLWGLLRPYNFHPRYSVAPHRLLIKHAPWRMQVHPDERASPLRRRERYCACPSNEEYRRYLGDMITELAVSYPLDALVLNYSGYGLRGGALEQSPYCFCASCRRRFAEDRSAEICTLASDPVRIHEVRQWQTELSTESLEYMSHRLNKARRTLRLLCRAHPQWRWTSVDSGPTVQAPYCVDWNGLLADATISGLVIDHDDERNPEFFTTRIASDFAELHQEALLLPTMRISRVSDFDEPLKTIRRYPVPGFFADFTDELSDDDADEIRERFLFPPAQLTATVPLVSAAFLLKRIRNSHRDNPLISDFMRDFLRLVEKAYRGETKFRSLEVIFKNLSGLQDAIRRGRLGDYTVPESTLRDISLARRLTRLACLDVRA